MQETKKILSIIIPTYNRSNIVLNTISLFREQMYRHSKEVELIVCDNCSNDNTQELLTNYKQKQDFFWLKKYDTHLEVGLSILRSIENGDGTFVLVWGDDDIPAPYMLDELLSLCNKYNSCNAIVFNRIQGNDYGENKLSNLSLYNDEYHECELVYNTSSEFVEKYYKEMSFISVSCIKRTAWIHGMKIYDGSEFGYEFLTPMLYGISGGTCVYISFPLCIQRHPRANQGKHAWGNRYPLYVYIGIPRVLKRLQSLRCIETDWKKCYKNQYNKLYLNDSAYSKYLMFFVKDFDFYKEYASEILELPVSQKMHILTKQIFSKGLMESKLGQLKIKMMNDGKYNYLKGKIRRVFN